MRNSETTRELKCQMIFPTGIDLMKNQVLRGLMDLNKTNLKSKGENSTRDSDDGQFLKRNFPSCTFTTMLVLFCICYMLFAIFAPSVLNARRSAWENRCKLTLKALGSSQLAFSDEHDGDYGTWNELTKTDYIQEGYMRDNIIGNYTIVTFDITKSEKNDDGEIIKPSTFTMIAIQKRRRSKLRTFAISEDQIPRVWVGNKNKWATHKMHLHNDELWEPLRQSRRYNEK